MLACAIADVDVIAMAQSFAVGLTAVHTHSRLSTGSFAASVILLIAALIAQAIASIVLAVCGIQNSHTADTTGERVLASAIADVDVIAMAQGRRGLDLTGEFRIHINRVGGYRRGGAGSILNAHRCILRGGDGVTTALRALSLDNEERPLAFQGLAAIGRIVAQQLVEHIAVAIGFLGLQGLGDREVNAVARTSSSVGGLFGLGAGRVLNIANRRRPVSNFSVNRVALGADKDEVKVIFFVQRRSIGVENPSVILTGSTATSTATVLAGPIMTQNLIRLVGVGQFFVSFDHKSDLQRLVTFPDFVSLHNINGGADIIGAARTVLHNSELRSIDIEELFGHQVARVHIDDATIMRAESRCGLNDLLDRVGTVYGGTAGIVLGQLGLHAISMLSNHGVSLRLNVRGNHPTAIGANEDQLEPLVVGNQLSRCLVQLVGGVGMIGLAIVRAHTILPHMRNGVAVGTTADLTHGLRNARCGSADFMVFMCDAAVFIDAHAVFPLVGTEGAVGITAKLTHTLLGASGITALVLGAIGEAQGTLAINPVVNTGLAVALAAAFDFADSLLAACSLAALVTSRFAVRQAAGFTDSRLSAGGGAASVFFARDIAAVAHTLAVLPFVTEGPATRNNNSLYDARIVCCRVDCLCRL